MKASDFELRHQALLHLLLVTVAFLTYLLQRDDVVWAWVKDSPQSQLLERSLFALATLLIGVGAGICTWVRTYPEPALDAVSAAARSGGPYRYVRYPRCLGNLLYSVGLGSLAPLPGFTILIAGQALLCFRLMRRSSALALAGTLPPQQRPQPAASFFPAFPVPGVAVNWVQAGRLEAGKWGLFLTMIVFTVLLVDRVAEILGVASFFLWLVLNPPQLRRSPRQE